MAEGDKEVSTYIDFTPTHAQSEYLRPQLEKLLRADLEKAVPAMVSRLAELEPLITQEVGEYSDFMLEATWAFAYGLWRGVVALIGIAAEGFTASLYNQIKRVRSAVGEEVEKEKLFGRDDYLPEQRKLAVLCLYGLVNKDAYGKLVRIKKLRDLYVHPQPKGRDAGQDAREAMTLFRAVLRERFEAKYTIKEGKIVERQVDKPGEELSSPA